MKMNVSQHDHVSHMLDIEVVWQSFSKNLNPRHKRNVLGVTLNCIQWENKST